jgi:hypothetical protein
MISIDWQFHKFSAQRSRRLKHLLTLVQFKTNASYISKISHMLRLLAFTSSSGVERLDTIMLHNGNK